MFRHNFLIAWRHARKNQTSFFINLIGLTVGLTCTLLIFLWVQHERCIDQFHSQEQPVYQILENVKQNGRIITRQTTCGPLAEALLEDVPEISKTVIATANLIPRYVMTVDQEDHPASTMYAGKEFFNIFSFELLAGDRHTVLTDVNSVVISSSLAKRIFGSDKNILGEVIQLNHETEVIISGVFADVPQTSTLKFDALLPWVGFVMKNEWVKSWGNTAPQTYLTLKEGTDVEKLNQKLTNYLNEKTNGGITHRHPFAVRFSDQYLRGMYENGVQAGGRIQYVRLFSLVALFILMLACINFMNLSTARAANRIVEVAIKKTIGARRKSLIYQYFCESIMVSAFALIMAYVLTWLILPSFNVLTGKELSLPISAGFIVAMAGFILLVGLVAGSYPALYLTGFSPMAMFRKRISRTLGALWARQGLVVFQFTISIVLITMVIIIYRQINFVQNEHLGYNKDQVIVFGKKGNLSDSLKMETFLVELKKIDGIINATTSEHDMTGHNGGTYGVNWPEKDPEDKTEFERMASHYDFIELLDMEIQQGRSFSPEFSQEASKIIFNQTAIEFMGLSDPVGKKIELWGQPMEIIGVVKDFNFESFHEPVKPVFIRWAPQATDYILIRIDDQNQAQTIASIQDLYVEMNPGFDFNYRFLDEDYQALYEAESKVATLSKYFALLAVLISCLGLFGLASFTAERRKKEIGIRKILGSSVASIMHLLSLEFNRLVFIAIAIGLPVSYLIASRWLQDFNRHVNLSWHYFALAGISAITIAWFTVGIQTFKAAHLNPIQSLQDE